jgi:hypothetical protein
VSSELDGLLCWDKTNGRLNLVHDQVDWVATHRSGLESPLRHQGFQQNTRYALRRSTPTSRGGSNAPLLSASTTLFFVVPPLSNFSIRRMLMTLIQIGRVTMAEGSMGKVAIIQEMSGDLAFFAAHFSIDTPTMCAVLA